MSDAREQRTVLARLTSRATHTVVVAVLLGGAACGHGSGGHVAARDRASDAATTTAPQLTTTTVPDYGAIYNALAKQPGATSTTVAPVATLHTISAVLYLRSATTDPGTTFGDGKHCVGTSPEFSDISDNTQAIVRDGSGRTLGTTLIGPGVVQHGVCTYHFAFRDVTEVSTYTFQLSNRPGPSRSLAALRASGWAVALLLAAR